MLLLKETKLNSHFTQHKDFMLCCGRIRVYVVLWSHQSLCCVVVTSEFMLCCGRIRVYVVLWSHQSLCCVVVASEFIWQDNQFKNLNIHNFHTFLEDQFTSASAQFERIFLNGATKLRSHPYTILGTHTVSSVFTVLSTLSIQSDACVTFIGPCIVIYFYSKTNQIHKFLIYIYIYI